MSACLYAGVMVGVPFLAVSNIALIVAPAKHYCLNLSTQVQ